MKEKKIDPQILFRIVVHIASWLPLLFLILDAIQNNLSADPIRAIMLCTGKTALIFLWLSLSCTPLHKLFGWAWLFPLRRNLGLYSFFYASLHVANFVWLDYGLEPGLIVEALLQKWYALFGAVSFLILLPMAATSWKWAFSLLGTKRWKQLHQFGYLAAILAIIHYFLLVKQAYAQPIFYTFLLALLFGIRLIRIGRKA
jgi:sulfoxide reductase heme-binding subunit YedZ